MDRSTRGRRDVFVARAMADLTKQLGQAETALAKARDDAMAPYWPEKLWMQSETSLACCVVALSTTIKAMCVVPSAAGAIRTSGTTTSVFEF